MITNFSQQPRSLGRTPLAVLRGAAPSSPPLPAPGASPASSRAVRGSRLSSAELIQEEEGGEDFAPAAERCRGLAGLTPNPTPWTWSLVPALTAETQSLTAPSWQLQGA